MMRGTRIPALILAMSMLTACGGEALPTVPATDAPTTSSTPATTTTSEATTTTQATAATTTTTTTTTTTEAPITCSAAGMTIPSLPAGLPAPVAEKVAAVAAATVACDLETLAGLSHPGGFVFTIDPRVDPDDPAAFWAVMDGFLGRLIELLSFSNDITDSALGPVYVWPAVAAYDNWFDAPEAARGEMEDLFTPEDIERFEFDGYSATRIGITENGEWIWFYCLDCGN